LQALAVLQAEGINPKAAARFNTEVHRERRASCLKRE
jgi:hypothetical protein